jgi:uncharacterized protein (DUF169 family)
MTSLTDLNRLAEDLEKIMLLRTSPMAVKMLEKESDIPDGAIRPKKDRGQHIAQCQAFAMSRRQKTTIAMLEEDNWCFAPVIAYGLEDKPEDQELQPFLRFPRFETGKYIGIVSAPLKTANFEPDVIIIYSNTAQLRNMLLPFSFDQRAKIDYRFFPPACAYQVVPVMTEGTAVVTLPDPGDYQRALAGEDEIILSLTPEQFETMVNNLKRFEEGQFRYSHAGMFMLHDFPRPEFYQMLFKRWGLDNEK